MPFECPQYFRSHAKMAEIVDAVACVVTEEDMLKKQLAFKRTTKCIMELDTAIKKQVQNLNGHVESVQKAKLDKEKQDRVKAEKAALASRSQELSQTASSIQAGTKPATYPVYQLKLEPLEKISYKQVNHGM